MARCAPREPAAEGLWPQLVEGRWRLLAHRCDANGLQYVVEQTSHHALLTREEGLVVDAAASGQCDKHIADRFGVRVTTAGRRLARALQKLGVARRTHLPMLRALLSRRDPAAAL